MKRPGCSRVVLVHRADRLVLADALARTVIEPRELPVGVLTALLGVPMMLWRLRRP